MNKYFLIVSSVLCFVLGVSSFHAQTKPNILWIITDDHRADALSCFNQATIGKSDSPLGYVSSPNIDKLASEGVLFVNAFSNSPACGPSRGSMTSGRYPFRNGHYAFEVTHKEPDFVKPTIPQVLRKQGYGTAVFGKEDSYIFKWKGKQGYYDTGMYDYKVHFKHDLQDNGLGDIYTKSNFEYIKGFRKKTGSKENIVFKDGTKKSYVIYRKGTDLKPEEIATKKGIDKEFDILRAYTQGMKDLIYGGVNPQPAEKTVDANILTEFKSYLNNQDQGFKTLWGKKAKGANSKKPLMVNLGFHLPHTPVLPPKKFRDQFKNKKYKIPAFSNEELEKLPVQLKKIYKGMKINTMKAKDKQQAIQDYYAFCAFGDYLIGDAVKTFKDYCKKNEQEYLIVFTVGDHGWHLGEQGIESKFGPWDKSIHNAAIVVSSDKTKYPAGKINKNTIEFVDFAPTILDAGGVDVTSKEYNYLDGFVISDVMNGTKKRDYVLGEMNLVCGPRAYLRTKDFAFSMQTRPTRKEPSGLEMNKNIEWALTCDMKEISPALYDLRKDPLERNNVADNQEYKELVTWFRNKLGNIVLGDGRVECDWSQANSYAISNFAGGADDKKIEIPTAIVPK
ncbi:arylsulfatase A-like enzyme [Wenyingzhuangia heitensis]|uniref:Arylsulfatase A-like enzyme n=1 Tax=Wenyingzhuangia heitensis TaxID=1487859 RepID=A0ABX0U9N9_9FLAO|nr:sulfatase-like hydrolase/transferase [Wenyingzhuangia heitensis]NIJ44943.1 arylsulfatase A-like enzyme [Wenyingzhuangia heitensis]